MRQWPKASGARQASFEGNARMPQTYLGIVVESVQHILSTTKPSEALGALLEPIPMDESLKTRTGKANRLHTRYGSKQVSPEDIREFECRGRIRTLRFMGMILDVEDRLSLSNHHFADDGSWVTPETREYVESLQERLAEDGESLRKILSWIQDVWTSPEVAAKLNERREAYRDFKSKDITARYEAVTNARMLSEDIRQAIESHFQEQMAKSEGKELRMAEIALNQIHNI